MFKNKSGISNYELIAYENLDTFNAHVSSNLHGGWDLYGLARFREGLFMLEMIRYVENDDFAYSEEEEILSDLFKKAAEGKITSDEKDYLKEMLKKKKECKNV